jgi:hypothetical protein
MDNSNPILRNNDFAKEIAKLPVDSILVSISFILLSVLEAFFDSTLLDEIFGLFSLLYILILFMEKRINQSDKKILLVFAIFLAFGFISSFFNYKNINFLFALEDSLANIKVFSFFFFVKYYINNRIKLVAVKKILSPFAKIFILFSFIFGIISLFFNLGMSNGTRFGIPSFVFVFKHQHQLSAIIYLCLTILSIDFKKKDLKFIIFSCVVLLLTTKGPSMICAILIPFFALYFRKHTKISFYIWILAAIIVLSLSKYQIQSYLLNPFSPRMLFFKYSIVTANDFFPLGSGFSTFGSDVAARHYSYLYIQYGFNEFGGLSLEDGSYLSDTGYPMYIAQCGYFGAIFFLSFLYLLFNVNSKLRLTYIERTIFVAVFIQYLIHAVGSAIFKSSQGMIGFGSLALIICEAKTPIQGNYNKKYESFSQKHFIKY